MAENDNQEKHRNMMWVKTNDGNTWLCPKADLVDPKSISEEELKACLDESQNPQNN
jgi:hypothetical protein